MEIVAEPKWQAKLSNQALNSLSYNSRRNVDGSEKTIINPAFESISDDEIIGRVSEILSKHYITPTLGKVEDSNMSKFGPRSHAKPWEARRKSLQDYYDGKSAHDPGEFPNVSGMLRPTPDVQVCGNLLKSSSAGLPYMTRKGLVLQKALKNWREEEGEYACVLFTRTQEQGKTRNVWGFPVSDTISEQRFFIPYLLVEKTFEHRKALVGPDAIDDAVTRLLMGKRDDEVMFCVDFSSFDASITPQHSFNAFSSIAALFQSQYHPEIYKVYQRFCNIPIYTPDGEWSGPHGVPSGSSFTNTIDSLVQFQVAGEPTRCQIQGDDGVYTVRVNDLDLFKERFKSAGLVLNPDKSSEFDTQEVIYLQRYFHPDYKSIRGGLGGVYSGMRAFNRIKYLERWTDFKKEKITGSDFFSLRTITILENCKHHPGFEDFVKLAHDFDRRNLAFTKSGLKAYSRSQESKVRAGVYNQYGLMKGIRKFETMKVLSKL
jgi:hypothetical protein